MSFSAPFLPQAYQTYPIKISKQKTKTFNILATIHPSSRYKSQYLPRRGKSGWHRGLWFTVCVVRGTLTYFWQVMQHLANGALLKKKKKKKSKTNTPPHASVQRHSPICALHKHHACHFNGYMELTPRPKSQSEDKTIIISVMNNKDYSKHVRTFCADSRR